MIKRNRNIKNIFIMLQRDKTPMQNYSEKVLYEKLTFEIPPLWIFGVVEGLNVTSPCGYGRI